VVVVVDACYGNGSLGRQRFVESGSFGHRLAVDGKKTPAKALAETNRFQMKRRDHFEVVDLKIILDKWE